VPSCAKPPAILFLFPAWSASPVPLSVAASASSGDFLEPLMRRAVVADLVGEPETLLVASTLLSVMHPSRLVSLNLRASEAQPG
jgi:hypothetical protein